ncbi:hypothetical protein POM88_001094 [Heracleum sosnowskyi]|uniref:Uncharacterized protein n=1 Tax=Heracleum sosnowskyi TaxID=360622 RepID=A0AAD8JDE6_9APIA|nr:hypothetical protein POM88_001094 [Heracleum sosnowskyi]
MTPNSSYDSRLDRNALTGNVPSNFINLINLDEFFENNLNLTFSLSIQFDMFSHSPTLCCSNLSHNKLSGPFPNLTGMNSVSYVNLSHNKLSGPFPNLTGMNSVSYVDLSNNSFEQSEAPAWFSKLSSLTTLVVEYGSFQGTVPYELLGLPQIQEVNLKNNNFSGILNLS